MRFLNLSIFILVSTVLSFSSLAAFKQEPPAWAYDQGPLLNSQDQEVRVRANELVELNSNIPYFPGVSYDIMGSQKFRPAFGPISWRMLLEPNSVKILFIGQDGTHIAEAAGRPATAGFGGRAHDLANYFGVDYSAAFINTYAFTIKGQYGARGVPYLKKGRLSFTSQYLDNELWLLSQDQNSPIVIWRNQLIDWIIRNNQDSLKMIVTFGGSARDSISSFIESKSNGEVGSKMKRSSLADIRMPEFKLEYAGGNNNFPVPIDREGKDIYAQVLGKKPNYVPPHNGKGDPDDQALVQKLLKANIDEYQDVMVFSRGGVDKSGLLHPAQLGGYDIDKITVNGEKSISIKGLELSDGSKVKNDVLVIDLPHPTYLSNVARSQGYGKVSSLVRKKTSKLIPWKQKGWKIPSDHGQFSSFFEGDGKYSYGRGEIGQEYYDFGTPKNRMVSKSDAKRIDPETILLGARKDKYLSSKAGRTVINKMKNDKPASSINRREMFIAISRTEEKYDFDPGPGEDLARIMKTSLYGTKEENLQAIAKANVTISDIEAVGDFGHYRGQAKGAKVLVLADPHGWDSIITARALTGARGQHLQGMVEAINDGQWGRTHFVLKTVPFGMDGAPGGMGATEEQWQKLLKLTQAYRQQVLDYLFENGDVQLVITDGQWASQAMAEYFQQSNTEYKKKWVSIDRTADHAEDMMKALKAIDLLGIKTDSQYSGERANIPSRHLSYYARVWEGTSNDRVITSKTQPGVAFAEVVPRWVVRQKPKMSLDTQAQVEVLQNILFESCLPNPGEEPDEFLRRRSSPRGMPSHCQAQ